MLQKTKSIPTSLAFGLAVGLGMGLTGAAPAAAQETVVVEMTQQLEFQPATVTISVGDTVEWRNTSNLPHTATFDPEQAADAGNVVLPEGVDPFGSGNLSGGDSFSHTFETPGRYQYVCLPHEKAGMIGENIVEE
jgi:plastocyanin